MSLAMVEYLCDVAIADIVQRHAPGKVWVRGTDHMERRNRSVSPLLSQAVAIQQRRLRIETSYLGLAPFKIVH
jgi:hypothetical protein